VAGEETRGYIPAHVFCRFEVDLDKLRVDWAANFLQREILIRIARWMTARGSDGKGGRIKALDYKPLFHVALLSPFFLPIHSAPNWPPWDSTQAENHPPSEWKTITSQTFD
jgi:hypothetical protein